MKGSEAGPAARSVIVRPVASLEELDLTEQEIASQFPPRRSAPAHALAALKAHFEHDRDLWLVAEEDGEILGGAMAHRTGEAVELDVIALKPEARAARDWPTTPGGDRV